MRYGMLKMRAKQNRPHPKYNIITEETQPVVGAAYSYDMLSGWLAAQQRTGTAVPGPAIIIQIGANWPFSSSVC